MKTRLLRFFSLMFLLILSIGAIVWQKYGLNRSFTITPETASHLNIYTVTDQSDGGLSYAWKEITNEQIFFHCEIIESDFKYPYCILAFQFGTTSKYRDLSIYDYVYLNLDYIDDIDQTIRISIKNTNPAYSNPHNSGADKPNAFEYSPKIDSAEVKIPLSYFRVPDWWVATYKTPIEYIQPEFNNANAIEISTGSRAELGHADMWIKEITFTGKIISYTTLTSALLIVWFSIAALFLFTSAVRFRFNHKADQLRVKALENVNKALNLQSLELERQANTDPLTGTYNRAGMKELLKTWQQKVQNDQMPLSVIFCDLDYFKKINDTYGHATGDIVIQQAAKLLQECTRTSDVVTRWGGEEFLCLCPNTTIKDAAHIADKLRIAFTQYKWQEELSVTCSFGVAQMHSNESVEAFIQRADKALYEAKSTGRNHVSLNTE